MRWEECIDEGSVRRVRADRNRAKSLLRLAENKWKVAMKININEENASVLFTMVYDVLLEISHAIAVSKGYKILNHLCTTAFLENMGLHGIAIKFDTYRKIRNGVNYYGRQLKKDFVEASLEDMENVKKRLESEYRKS